MARHELSNSRPKPLLPTLVTGWLLGLSIAALAAKPDGITSTEMALLPSYCADAQGFKYGDASYNTSPNAPKWVSLMGKGFWAVHHHCWALIRLRRAERASMSQVLKQGHWEAALADFWYVVNNTSSDFILLPEIFTYIGRTELLLGRPIPARDAFDRARTLKPDYWPAYSHWAEFLIRQGMRKEAKELVKSGLEYAPTTKVLVEQYRLLGGNPAEIVPKPTPAKDDSEAAAKTDDQDDGAGGNPAASEETPTTSAESK